MLGSRIAHYEITGHLGSGGMGEVYQATDTKLERSVAIKVLPDEFAREAERVARFEREAKVLASLNHPKIAAIHGLEEYGGRKFLVMELVEGETLAERIARGPIPVDEALAIGKETMICLTDDRQRETTHRRIHYAVRGTSWAVFTRYEPGRVRKRRLWSPGDFRPAVSHRD